MLSKIKADLFEEKFNKCTRREAEEKTGFVCTVEIEMENYQEIVDFVKTNKINFNDRDIFCSVCSESDSEIWEAPRAVYKILNQLECKLTLSFTCVA